HFKGGGLVPGGGLLFLQSHQKINIEFVVLSDISKKRCSQLMALDPNAQRLDGVENPIDSTFCGEEISAVTLNPGNMTLDQSFASAVANSSSEFQAFIKVVHGLSRLA